MNPDEVKSKDNNASGIPPFDQLYVPEMWVVRKDDIYSAIMAIENAIGYMTLVETQVPRWRERTAIDIIQMKKALEALQKMP